MRHAALRLVDAVPEKALARKVNFTVAVVDAAACRRGQDRTTIYDSRTPGLALRITAKGEKTFVVYRRWRGRPERFTLDTYPKITIEQARALAAKVNFWVAEGKDPRVELGQQRIQGKTLDDLFEWYMDNHAKPRNRSWHNDEVRYNKHIKPRLGHIEIARIAREDVAALHRAVAEKRSGTTANRILALLSTMFNKAHLMGHKGENPATGIQHFREESRDRFLDNTEMPRFIAALESPETPPDWQDFFWLLLLTGVRSGNMKALRWDEVDLENGMWHIPGTKAKSGKPLYVYLPERAVSILQDRKRHADSDEVWVFPAHSRSGHVEEPRGTVAANSGSRWPCSTPPHSRSPPHLG